LIRHLIFVALIGFISTPAFAFCGFFVSGADADLVNDATQVALMRKGNRTVLSMSNTYKGPPEDFAMVVPVPVVLGKEQVKTLHRNVFRAVDQISAPRLVEYWEQDPCRKRFEAEGMKMGGVGSGGLGTRGLGRGGGGFGVTVEAKFTAGEYEIVILSAKEANGLEGWLKSNGYKIPAGAAGALAPYVREEMKFFVAKVNIKKVIRDERGAVVLSPLRFDYEAPTLRLPVRLGLLNAKGKQDLLVYVLHPSSRFEVANYENIFIPSNLEVENEVRTRFGDFYAALFDATLAQAKRPAVVTEYAWQTTSCDPCPRPPLTPKDLQALGGDLLNAGAQINLPILEQVEVQGGLETNVVKHVLRRSRHLLTRCQQLATQGKMGTDGALKLELTVNTKGRVITTKIVESKKMKGAECIKRQVRRLRFPHVAGKEGPLTILAAWKIRPSSRRRPPNFSKWVLTRLHTRYDADTLDEDLVFVEAGPVRGGRGAGGINQEMPGAVETSRVNQFQGRYIIRHYWEGEVACKSPAWGQWGGSVTGPNGGGGGGTKKKAIAGKRTIERSGPPMSLPTFVRSSLPLLGLKGKDRPAKKGEAR